jgi:hypothetical protein
VFPLDGLPVPAVAYSDLRLLTSYSGNAKRIYNETSTVETNYGFTGAGIINSAQILADLGTNTGTVATVFNQGSLGAAADVTQSTLTLRPRFAVGGSLSGTIGTNSIPTRVAGTVAERRLLSPSLTVSSVVGAGGTEVTIIAVFRQSGARAGYVRLPDSGLQFLGIHDDYDGQLFFDCGDVGTGGRWSGTTDMTNTVDRVRVFQRSGASGLVSLNGTTTRTPSFTNSTLPANAALTLGTVIGSQADAFCGTVAIWPSVLSTADLSTAVTRLRNAYGI